MVLGTDPARPSDTLTSQKVDVRGGVGYCLHPSKNVKAVGVTSTPTLGGRASANVTIRVTNMSVVKTRQVTVQLTRDVPLLLDGERVVGKKAEISFVSDAVNVIVPKPNQGILLFTDFKCNFLQRGVRIY